MRRPWMVLGLLGGNSCPTARSRGSPAVYAGLFGDDWTPRRAELRAASIGPVTSAELRRQGVEPAVEAARPADAELAAAVAAAVIGS